MKEIETTIQGYRSTFGGAATVVAQAPGRVNLIGEHTDYNQGLVLPFAIDRAIRVAAGLGKREVVQVHSAALGETVTFPCEVSEPADERPWQNYARGVVAGLRRRGVASKGAELWIEGNLPMGHGLGSSAALCVAITLALARLAGAGLRPRDIVELAQVAEREFAGTPCGIMDPYASMFGQAGHALLLDCRSNTHEGVPLSLQRVELLAVPSGAEHDLSCSAYEQRVHECHGAVAELSAVEPGIRSLRDVTEGMLRGSPAKLDAIAAKRAYHVVTENRRVVEAVAALRSGRLEDLGRLLNASHDSLRDNYEVSCPEVEALIAALRADDDVLGARMIGGGFGGTVLALVRKGAARRLIDTFNEHGPLAPGRAAEAHIVHPAAGAFSRGLETGME